MGVESDHLVYDYLSRVGDLAQSALSADRRMRLITELRKNIDQERGASGSGDDAATVRRILGRLGTPDEVVKARSAAGAAGRAKEPPAEKEAKEPDRPRPHPGGEAHDAAKAAEGEPGPAIPLPRDEAGLSGEGGEEPEWWRVVPGQRLSAARTNAARTNEVLAGWTGGLLPPETDDEGDEGDEDTEAAQDQGQGQGQDKGPGADASGGVWRALRIRRRRASPGGEAVVVRRRRLPVGAFELLAALALMAGVVTGSWWALAVGWSVGYTTRGLSRTEAKWAVLGMPGLVTAGALVWLWGRTHGRWGSPLNGALLGQEFAADFPVLVKVAAVASALFLLWRSARRFR